MSEQRDIDLVNELLSLGSETEWCEFKRNNAAPDMLGVRCAAMANAARLVGQETAYMLWGIDSDRFEVVGTNFNPDREKANGQELAFWLARQLKPSVCFQFRIVNHPQGRVIILEIPAATSAPVAFKNIPYIRIGSATPKLTDYPERYQRLIEELRPYRWEHATAKKYVTGDEVLNLLDYSNYFKLTQQPLPDNRAGIFEKLSADKLIVKDVGGKWNITNLGAILFASDINQFDSDIARKSVRFVAYSGKNRTAKVGNRIDGMKGYAVGFEGLIEFIIGILPKNEHIDLALRTEQPLFPTVAIRELIANALIHQDMTVTGAGPQIEVFEDRMEITNPGRPLMPADRMIDLPPRSRNETLAALMRRMGMCEEQGSGLDKA